MGHTDEVFHTSQLWEWENCGPFLPINSIQICTLILFRLYQYQSNAIEICTTQNQDVLICTLCMNLLFMLAHFNLETCKFISFPTLECDCNPNGAIESNGRPLCNKTTGQCDCRENVQGDRCSECMVRQQLGSYCHSTTMSLYTISCSQLHIFQTSMHIMIILACQVSTQFLSCILQLNFCVCTCSLASTM